MTLHFDRFENGVVIAEVLRSLHQEVALEMCRSGARLIRNVVNYSIGISFDDQASVYKYDFKTSHI